MPISRSVHDQVGWGSEQSDQGNLPAHCRGALDYMNCKSSLPTQTIPCFCENSIFLCRYDAFPVVKILARADLCIHYHIQTENYHILFSEGIAPNISFAILLLLIRL